MILGLATNTESSSLHVGENDANEFSKRGRVEDRHTLRPTLFGITTIHSVSSHGAVALSAVLAQPTVRRSQIEKFEDKNKNVKNKEKVAYQIIANTCFTFSALPPAPSCFMTSVAICFNVHPSY